VFAGSVLALPARLMFPVLMFPILIFPVLMVLPPRFTVMLLLTLPPP
jgi:hypothetical protein